MTHQPTERTFTSEDYEKAAIDVCTPDSEPIPSTLAAMLRQGATAEAALAEAQRERDAAEESARQMQERLQRAIDGAKVERQKVTALREELQHVLDASWLTPNTKAVYQRVLNRIDALWPTAQPPQDAEPAT